MCIFNKFPINVLGMLIFSESLVPNFVRVVLCWLYFQYVSSFVQTDTSPEMGQKMIDDQTVFFMYSKYECLYRIINKTIYIWEKIKLFCSSKSFLIF